MCSVAGTSAAGVTQGIHRAVLDWSTGIIAKLAGGLPPPSNTKTHSPAAAATAVGDNINERHARNSRRWLLDLRTWKAFVLSLEGAVERAEPSTHVPQSAGLSVFRAAVYTICEVEMGERNGGDAGSKGNAELAVAAVGDWAFAAIRALCSGDFTDKPAYSENISAFGSDIASDRAHLHLVGVYDSEWSGVAAPEGTVDNGWNCDEKKEGWKRGRGRRPGPLVRMTLDACMTLVVEEVIRGRIWEAAYRGGGGDGSDGASRTATKSRGTTRLERVLTELLHFQRVLQEQQTNRRKVRYDETPVEGTLDYDDEVWYHADSCAGTVFCNPPLHIVQKTSVKMIQYDCCYSLLSEYTAGYLE